MNENDFKVGDWVKHKEHGIGRVGIRSGMSLGDGYIFFTWLEVDDSKQRYEWAYPSELTKLTPKFNNLEEMFEEVKMNDNDFNVNDWVDHGLFGIGVVIEKTYNDIEVYYPKTRGSYRGHESHIKKLTPKFSNLECLFEETQSKDESAFVLDFEDKTKPDEKEKRTFKDMVKECSFKGKSFFALKQIFDVGEKVALIYNKGYPGEYLMIDTIKEVKRDCYILESWKAVAFQEDCIYKINDPEILIKSGKVRYIGPNITQFGDYLKTNATLKLTEVCGLHPKSSWIFAKCIYQTDFVEVGFSLDINHIELVLD